MTKSVLPRLSTEQQAQLEAWENRTLTPAELRRESTHRGQSRSAKVLLAW